MSKLHKKIDKQTITMIDDHHGLLDVLDAVLGYIQLCNKDIVAIKTLLNEHADQDVNPLSDVEKKMLREGGDMILKLRKIIEQGRRIKSNATE